MKKLIGKAKQVIKEADAMLITAGAGMGVDSGLPDFRGKEGFWRAYPIAKKLGLRFEELANPRWFREDPELAWAFYGHRLKTYRETNPHEGFYIPKKLGELKNNDYFVFTSNVDGQFQKAGYPEDRIVEIHGSIHHLQCTLPCCDDIWSAKGIEIKIDKEKFRAILPLPRCKHCGRLARPNILMFNDFHWVPIRTESQEFRLRVWLNSVIRKNKKLAIIEIGAGTAVPTVRYFSERTARETKGTLIRINPKDYQVPEGHIGIPLKGLEGIKEITKDII